MSLNLILIGCVKEKPTYVNYGDYSYLTEEEKKVLLVLKLEIENVEEDYHRFLDSEIQKVISNYNFQLSYRRYLARQLYKWDSAGRLRIQFNRASESRNLVLIDYMNKGYPKFVLKDYDLILEIRVNVLLLFNLSYLNMIKRERVELWNQKKSRNYLSSLNSYTYQSIGNKIYLKKNPLYARQLIEHFIHRSTENVVKYLLNIEQKPREEDITPSLPQLEN